MLILKINNKTMREKAKNQKQVDIEVIKGHFLSTTLSTKKEKLCK